MPAPVAVGDVLVEKYRVTRIVAAGGMGVVVAATHIQLDEPVALKFMLPEMLGSADGGARFLREARAAAKLRSEHVARVSDFGTLENGTSYIVMEYLEGEDLADMLEKRGQLPSEEAAELVIQACDAIAEAHALGIVHRDLKPANLFVARRRDGSPLVKVLDFGISKTSTLHESAPALTKVGGGILGSPLYMSPEQTKSARDVDARTDVWALGVILYQLIAGRPPFDGDTLGGLIACVLTESPASLRTLVPDVPLGVDEIVGKCLEKNRDARWSSIANLARALAPFAPHRVRALAERIGAVAVPAVADGGSAGAFARTAHADGESQGPASWSSPTMAAPASSVGPVLSSNLAFDATSAGAEPRPPSAGAASSAAGLESLQPIVEALAIDGVIDANEIEHLVKRIGDRGLAATRDEAVTIARRAIELYSGGAQTQWRTGESVAAVAVERVATTGPVRATPAWDVERGLALALERTRHALRESKAKLTVVMAQDRSTGELVVRFDHAVWKEHHALAAFAGPLWDAHGAWLITSGFNDSPLISPFARGVWSAVRSESHLVERLVLSPGNDGSGPRSRLTDARLTDFVEDVVKRLPPWVEVLRPIFEATWDALPEWARVVSTNKEIKLSRVAKVAEASDAASDPFFALIYASLLQEAGKAAEALTWYRRLIQLKPELKTGYVGAGCVAFQQKQWLASWQYFDDALRKFDIASLEPEELEQAASSAYQAKRLDWYLKLCEQVLHREPERANALNAYGWALYRLRRLPEAEACFRRCVDEGRDFPHALRNLGRVLGEKGAYDEAISFLQRDVTKDGRVCAPTKRRIAELEQIRFSGAAPAYVDDEEGNAPPGEDR